MIQPVIIDPACIYTQSPKKSYAKRCATIAGGGALAGAAWGGLDMLVSQGVRYQAKGIAGKAKYLGVNAAYFAFGALVFNMGIDLFKKIFD